MCRWGGKEATHEAGSSSELRRIFFLPYMVFSPGYWIRDLWVGIRVTRKIRVGYFGFSEMLPEIYSEKSIPDISGTRKFGFGFGFTRYARNFPICKPPPGGAPLLSPEVDAQQPSARAAPRRGARDRRRPEVGEREVLRRLAVENSRS